jgi:hypothetical protein
LLIKHCSQIIFGALIIIQLVQNYFFKIPLNLEEQPRQTFEFSGSCFSFVTYKSEKHLIIQNLFERRAIKTPTNLSTTLTSSLPTGLFGQNLAQSRSNNFDTDTSLFKSLTLYYKRLIPK